MLSYSICAGMTKYHRLDNLKQQKFFTVVDTGKVEIKAPQVSCLVKAALCASRQYLVYGVLGREGTNTVSSHAERTEGEAGLSQLPLTLSQGTNPFTMEEPSQFHQRPPLIPTTTGLCFNMNFGGKMFKSQHVSNSLIKGGK